MLTITKNLPIEQQDTSVRNNLGRIIVLNTRKLANDELFAAGISIDHQAAQIERFLAPRKEHYTTWEMLPYSQILNRDDQYNQDIIKRIQSGNSTKEILDKTKLHDVPAEVLADLSAKICDGKTASWVYVQNNLGLAVSAVKSFSRRNDMLCSCGQDVLQEAIITMFEATQNYNADRGCSLSTFSTMVLKRRMLRFTKKYISFFHVSEDDLKKAFDQYIAKEKADEAKSGNGVERHEATGKFEELTEIRSLDEFVCGNDQCLGETIADENMDDPAKVVENKLFKTWLDDTVHKAIQDIHYSDELEEMFRKIVIHDEKTSVYAKKFDVSERTIRNWIHKMTEAIKKELLKNSEWLPKIAGFVHLPEAVAESSAKRVKAKITEGNILQEKPLGIEKMSQICGTGDSNKILPLAA